LANTPLTPGAVANPCGIVAATIFNDSYNLYQGNTFINISDKNIAWPSDLSRFKVTNLS
jgi:hypothetical protein